MSSRLTRRLVVTGGLASLAAGFLGSGAAAPQIPQTHRIVIGTMAFGPAPFGIHVGDTVEWVNEDIFRHSVTAADKSFDVDIEPHATAPVVMKTAGTIAYLCKYHPSMKAHLVVTKAP
jgi:plastocyanin